jgi:hypothetical protein
MSVVAGRFPREFSWPTTGSVDEAAARIEAVLGPAGLDEVILQTLWTLAFQMTCTQTKLDRLLPLARARNIDTSVQPPWPEQIPGPLHPRN